MSIPERKEEGIVPEPIVFISTLRVKEGKLAAFKEHFSGNVPRMEEAKPGTVVFCAYLNEAETEVNVVHMFPDAVAMDAHMEGVAERSQKAFQFVEPLRWDIYGSPSSQVMEAMTQAAQRASAELVVRPRPLAGYAHLEGA